MSLGAARSANSDWRRSWRESADQSTSTSNGNGNGAYTEEHDSWHSHNGNGVETGEQYWQATQGHYYEADTSQGGTYQAHPQDTWHEGQHSGNGWHAYSYERGHDDQYAQGDATDYQQQYVEPHHNDWTAWRQDQYTDEQRYAHDHVGPSGSTEDDAYGGQRWSRYGQEEQAQEPEGHDEGPSSGGDALFTDAFRVCARAMTRVMVGAQT